MELMLTSLTYLLALTVCALSLVILTNVMRTRSQANGKKSESGIRIKPLLPPGPVSLPFLGNLLTFACYRDAHEAFADFRRKYGSIFSFHIGYQKCVVLSGYSAVKEMLITRSASFGKRPNFVRYNRLFGGDRDNSLAFCDWSGLQKTRRKIVHSFMFPRLHSLKGELLENSINTEICEMIEKMRHFDAKPVKPKPLLLQTCANIFFSYLCSQKFDFDDREFVKMVNEFDSIFYEINQEYAIDFFPWLSCFYSKYLTQLETWSKSIRHFIMQHIIEPHLQTFDENIKRDIVDDLIENVNNECGDINWSSALFALEDLLGGFSAVANFWLQTLLKIANHPHVMKTIQKEISDLKDDTRQVMLEDRAQMPYTEATLLESLRTISSPIVPQISSEDTLISGYLIEADTMIIINNHELNHSSELWTNPEEFDPSRFIKTGKVVKPEFFIPFSTGKRACMGHRLVLNIAFLGISRLLQEADVSVTCDTHHHKLPKNRLALPYDTFPLTFTFKK